MTGAVRSTRQRAAIADLLNETDGFRSAQELHDELRRRGQGIGLTTVYRTLQSMATTGSVDTLRTDTGESVYRRCSEEHHHHLVCRACGATVESTRSMQFGFICGKSKVSKSVGICVRRCRT